MAKRSKTMADPAPPGSRPERGTKVAWIEGYIALGCVAALFLNLVPTHWVGLSPPLDQVVAITVWAFGWLFAISGSRRGRGGARIAAWFSLAILILHALVILSVVALGA